MMPSLPRATWLDRAIGAVDPQRAVARLKARTQLHLAGAMAEAMAASPGPTVSASLGGGYASADTADPWMRRWTVMPRDAASDTLRQAPTLRAQSRDLVRNHALAASAIQTNVARAVGTGLAYSAQPNLAVLRWTAEQGEAWRAQVQAEFSLFADSRECDWLGEQTFYEKQALVLHAALESGDCFTVLPDAPRASATMPYRLRLQTIEADRVGNPRGAADTAQVAGGIRRDAADPQRAAYHLYRRHPGAAIVGADLWAGDWVEAVGRSGRRRILHHFRMTRPDQPRGVPYLAPVMGLFRLLGTYTDAEVKAAVVSAFLTVFIETDAGVGLAPVFGVGDPQAGRVPAAGQGSTEGPAGDEIALGPAQVIGLAKGEKANAVTPGRPNPAFGDFVSAVLDQLGAGLFIGPEMLMKKYATSYVAARAAFLDAWTHLRGLRTLVAISFCQPVLETWMAEAVALGRISAPGFFQDPLLRWAYTRAAWQGDSQGSINPRDEVSAYRDAVDARLLSRERAEWELFGTDWRDTYATKLAEQRRMAADDMLPVPKAGAPAPVRSGAGDAP